jgi:hypothetical protein
MKIRKNPNILHTHKLYPTPQKKTLQAAHDVLGIIESKMKPTPEELASLSPNPDNVQPVRTHDPSGKNDPNNQVVIPPSDPLNIPIEDITIEKFKEACRADALHDLQALKIIIAGGRAARNAASRVKAIGVKWGYGFGMPAQTADINVRSSLADLITAEHSPASAQPSPTLSPGNGASRGTHGRPSASILDLVAPVIVPPGQADADDEEDS